MSLEMEIIDLKETVIMYQEVNTELDAEINKKEKENSVLHTGTKENEKLLQHIMYKVQW